MFVVKTMRCKKGGRFFVLVNSFILLQHHHGTQKSARMCQCGRPLCLLGMSLAVHTTHMCLSWASERRWIYSFFISFLFFVCVCKETHTHTRRFTSELLSALSHSLWSIFKATTQRLLKKKNIEGRETHTQNDDALHVGRARAHSSRVKSTSRESGGERRMSLSSSSSQHLWVDSFLIFFLF